MKNRTRHLQLRDSLEELSCSLQDPKLSHFVDPVPSQILDVLNIGGFTAIGSNSASMGGVGNSVVGSSYGGMGLDDSRKHSSSRSRQALRGQRQFASSQENTVESKMRKRRKRQEAAQKEKDLAAVAPAHKRYDYYDDNNGGLSLGHGLDLDDNLNLHKQGSFYGAASPVSGHNDVDVLLSSGHTPVGDALDAMANKNTINVRLFLLKPEMLPCHDELSDPTELPLSRDLMDVRSNVGQESSLGGAAALAKGFGLLVVLLALAVSQG